MYYCWQVSHIHLIRTLISTVCLWVGYETTSSKFSNWAYCIMKAKLCPCFSQLNGIYCPFYFSIFSIYPVIVGSYWTLSQTWETASAARWAFPNCWDRSVIRPTFHWTALSRRSRSGGFAAAPSSNRNDSYCALSSFLYGRWRTTLWMNLGRRRWHHAI